MKKVLALLLMVSMMTALFVGCGTDEEKATDGTTTTTAKADDSSTSTDGGSDTTEATDTSASVELRVVTMFGGTDPSTEIFEQQLVDFQAANPNIKIVNESMTSVGDEYRTAVKTDFSTGNEADVVFFYTGADVEGIIASGGVMSYEEIWETYPEVGADLNPGILDSMRVDGNLYALPLTGFYEGLFVNTALFEQYNLELPTNWDNLLKAIEVLNENGVTPFAGPIAQSHYLIEHFILSEAGVVGHQNVLDGEVPQSWVDGLDNIKTLYDMNAFAADALSMDIEMSQILFRQGDAGMILEGSWFIGGCDEALQANMTVMPMPTAPGGAKDPTSIVSGFSSGYYISRKAYESEKQQAAVNLVTYLTSAKSVAAIAGANGGTPSVKAEVAVPVEGLGQLALDGHAMAAAAVAITMPIDSRLTPEAFNYIVKDGVPFIAFGERTSEEVLEEVKTIQNR